MLENGEFWKTSRLNHCRMFLKDHVGYDDAERLKLVSCDEQVSKYTPPTFLYNTFEDKLTNAENVLYYAENLKNTKSLLKCTFFQKGGTANPGVTVLSGQHLCEGRIIIISVFPSSGCVNCLDLWRQNNECL